MGMALDEPTDEQEKLDSNGIEAYIDPDLYEGISQRGNIYIDFSTDRFGSTGFSIRVKKHEFEPDSCE